MLTTFGLVVAFAVGVWIGNRWARVRQEAYCREGLCGKLLAARADVLAQGLKLEDAYRTIREARSSIHGLKSSKGALVQEIQRMAFLKQPEAR